MVIDKEKTCRDVYREIYDVKLKKVVHTDGCQLSDDYHWETPREPQVKEETAIELLKQAKQTNLSDMFAEEVK